MNVDIMKKVFNDSDDGKDVVGTRLIKRWKHDEGSLKLWRASSNFIYTFRENDKRKILRVTPDAERTLDLLLAEKDFTDHLRKKGIPIPKPIPSLDQNKIETLITDFGTFHGIVTDFIEGDCIDDHNEFDDERFVEWGRILARIHKAALSFKPNPKRRRKTWEE
ncbi:MAG: phosphotransferase enzyme family protein, partial [Candidatus Heimdallarchaeota archaeon]